MASNRAIMPRGAVASHQLPDDVERHADTRSATARAAATARFCCSSMPISPAEMAFNSYTSFAVCASKFVRSTKSFAGLLKFPRQRSVRTRRPNPKLKLIRKILLGTRGRQVSDRRSPLHPISRHKQPCPGRERSSCIAASRTWAQSERGHPLRVMTAPAA